MQIIYVTLLKAHNLNNIRLLVLIPRAAIQAMRRVVLRATAGALAYFGGFGSYLHVQRLSEVPT